MEVEAVLSRDLGFSIRDLPGLVELGLSAGQRVLMAPPIIEVQSRSDMDRNRRPLPGEERVLIDGLHRVYLAGDTVGQPIRAVEIRHIPYPPIAYSSSWSALEQYDDPPREPEMKRWYRYPTYEEWRASEFAEAIPASPETCRYALYRDLSLLGSPGSRLHAPNGA
jgi:hypothetical protein